MLVAAADTLIQALQATESQALPTILLATCAKQKVNAHVTFDLLGTLNLHDTKSWQMQKGETATQSRGKASHVDSTHYSRFLFCISDSSRADAAACQGKAAMWSPVKGPYQHLITFPACVTVQCLMQVPGRCIAEAAIRRRSEGCYDDSTHHL